MGKKISCIIFLYYLIRKKNQSGDLLFQLIYDFNLSEILPHSSS